MVQQRICEQKNDRFEFVFNETLYIDGPRVCDWSLRQVRQSHPPKNLTVQHSTGTPRGVILIAQRDVSANELIIEEVPMLVMWHRIPLSVVDEKTRNTIPENQVRSILHNVLARPQCAVILAKMNELHSVKANDIASTFFSNAFAVEERPQ